MYLKNFVILLFLSGLSLSLYAGDSISRQGGRPKVGLVLSGGGAKGIAHVGALRVIEELGIPVDYIGGASMGSIVGGLTAIGYTSGQLETYIARTDWDILLMDRVGRRHISIYEKGERKRYWLQFPFSGGKIGLPKGFLTGQNVTNLFTELASPAYDRVDFSQLPTPFLCTATDIETGEEVVLEHGNLAKAMRASMAIPSVFTPEIIDGRTLFDGGLTNNFPADKIKEKGMDIIIGIDVTSQAEAGELTNIYNIMEQVVFMSSLPLKEANKKLCNILIVPDIPEYGASSFNAADSLLARGERAAREHYKELRDLAVYLNSFPTDEEVIIGDCPQPLEGFYVKNIKITGLKNTSRDYFLNRLDIDTLEMLTFSDLNRAMDRIKGSQVFESVVYHLNPQPDGTLQLQFDCVEQSVNLFRIGLHYDKEYKASLLLNVTLRNVILNNSKIWAELSIGENPEFGLSYLHSPGVKPVGKTLFKSSIIPDWLFHFNAYQFDAYNYVGNQRTNAYSFTSITTGIKLLINPTINSVIGGGFSGDYVMINNKVGQDSSEIKSNYTYLTTHFQYEHDSYNTDYFPTEGNSINIGFSYNKGLSKNVRYSESIVGVILRSNFAVSPFKRWTLHYGISGSSTFGTDIPPQYLVYLGGLSGKLTRNNLRFTGMYFMQKPAKNGWVAHLNNQVRLWQNIYIVFRADIGTATDELKKLFQPDDLWVGYGVSAQYNSVIGPVGFTLSSSNATRSLIGAINIGYWF